jgi:arginyl-tRNA synthetase
VKIQDFAASILDETRSIMSSLYDARDCELVVTDPPDNIDAEYSVPCFPVAKIARQAPARIAMEIKSRFPDLSWLDSVEVSGPYLNFRLKKQALISTVVNQALEEKTTFGHTAREKPGTILVEYSSPNTNKPLHLGHIRNNVLGMAMINLLTAVGHRVIPATILNDRGIHICKAMVAYRRFGEGKTPESENLKGDHFVGKYYVAFDQASRSDPQMMDAAREMLRDWEADDPAVKELWTTMNQWVYDGFDQTYRRMGSKFDVVQHESRTYRHGRTLVEEGLDKGILFRKDDGSVWIDLSDIGLDEKILLRADGTSVYITQDLGVAVERSRMYRPDQVIYVVGSEQRYHFQVLFEILKRLGYSWADRCAHLSYGMVYLPDGKMKSREGRVVDADDLMNQMRTMALNIMTSSSIDHGDVDLEETAESIGLGAIKYYILKVNPHKDIHFDPEASLSFEGSTGAYLQYTYARIQSMIRKSGETPESGWNLDGLDSSEETSLVRTLLRYPGVVTDAADDLNPSRVAVYLWELAKAFNVFYHRHRVLDAANGSLRSARLALCAAAAAGLQSGMAILGIQPLQKM